MLGVKVLVRAGACRPREELARSFTSLPPLDLDHALLFALLLSIATRDEVLASLMCIPEAGTSSWFLFGSRCFARACCYREHILSLFRSRVLL